MHPSAILFLTVIVVALPLLALASKKKIDQGITFPKIPFYVEAIVLQTILASLALWAASRSGVAIETALPQKTAPIIAAVLLLVVSLVSMAIALRSSADERKRLLVAIVPFTGQERAMWILVSSAAGIGEEIAYRGVLFRFAERFLPSFASALILTSIIFGLAHLVQGWKAAAAVALFGAAFQLLVAASGTLILAIVVHFLYDLVTGFFVARKLAGSFSLPENEEAVTR